MYNLNQHAQGPKLKVLQVAELQHDNLIVLTSHTT